MTKGALLSLLGAGFDVAEGTLLSFLKVASEEACFDLSKVPSLPWEGAAGEGFDDLAKGALLSLLGACFDLAMGAVL